MKALLFLLGGFAVLGSGRAAEQTLAVDKAHSRVEVVVKATVDSFVAKLSDYDVSVTVDPDQGRVCGATFAFRFADLFTGKADRDREMLSWEDAAHFPTGTFTLSALEPAPTGGYTARGLLRLHGVEKAVEFPVAVATDHRLYSIDGGLTLDTRDFGLEVIRKLLVLKVDPAVQVRFHLQGVVANP
jgi:polyisoprenoid-binding protein YceI